MAGRPIDTVKIVWPSAKNGFAIINAVDFKFGVHELWKPNKGRPIEIHLQKPKPKPKPTPAPVPDPVPTESASPSPSPSSVPTESVSHSASPTISPIDDVVVDVATTDIKETVEKPQKTYVRRGRPRKKK